MAQVVISIVTGTYNRLNLLQSMIESVQGQMPVGFAYEIVIVDGGSTDGTLEYLKTVDHCTVIEHGELRGAIPAFCDGAYAAKGKYVVLANDDVTFKRGSLLAAYMHLEHNMKCGAVAFADNRPALHKKNGECATCYMPAQTDNPAKPWVVYAQVGIFRKWLGDEVHWWGVAPDGTQAINAKTYGGDNLLSARIWEAGYTVDEVDGCIVYDSVYDDDLRIHNTANGDRGYVELFPHGPTVARSIMIEQRDTEDIRVLYLPIYEKHAVQHEQKRGLREALQKQCTVIEVDYLNTPDVSKAVSDHIQVFRPQIILTQFHGADELTVSLLRQFRQEYPQALVINWNGDYWPRGLVAPDVLKMLRHVDLQLVVNGSVINTYAQHGIQAAYWQIGYEEPGDDLPDVPAHDVVFLGNNYSPEREALGAFLRGLDGINVGIYGEGWKNAQGECLYDFTTGKALYQNAKIAIGDNQFTEAYGYVSNRIFQALAAGGALLLHQEVKGLEDLTGLVDFKHYVPWSDFEELQRHIHVYLSDDEKRQSVANEGTQYTRNHHSFDVRVTELLGLIENHAPRKIGGVVTVQFPNGSKGGVVGAVTNQQYFYQPPAPLEVDSRDAQVLVSQGWMIVNGN